MRTRGKASPAGLAVLLGLAIVLAAAPSGTLYAVGGTDGHGPQAGVDDSDPVGTPRAGGPRTLESDAERIAARGGRWSTTALSAPREDMTAVTVGSQVLFVGGCADACWHPRAWHASPAVDLYDAATATWSTARLSESRAYLTTVRVADRLLFAGGLQSYEGPATAAVDLYNATTGEWSTAHLSEPRYKIGAATVGSKALFAGGQNRAGTTVQASAAVDIYDAATGQWSAASLSQPMSEPAVATVGSQVLIAAGDLVDIYDDASGAWSTASLSEARSEYAVATVGTRVLFVGGYLCPSVPNSNSCDPLPVATVDIYDAATGQWSTASLSEPRRGIAVATIGTKVLLAGGDGEHFTRSATVDIYDSATGQWSSARLSEPRYRISVAKVGTQVLFAGGLGTDNIGSAALDQYDAATGRWSTARLRSGGAEPHMAIVGDEVVFASGTDVDIYDAATGQWSSTILSEYRNVYTVGAAGTQVLFAGGEGCTIRLPDASPLSHGCVEIGSRATVDVYDSAAGD